MMRKGEIQSGAPGESFTTEGAKREKSPAAEDVTGDKSKKPTSNTTKGPNAASTYAYGPPVASTRLPASAKHITTRPITIAQVRYASGAAAPSCRTANAGSAKMPLPTV